MSKGQLAMLVLPIVMIAVAAGFTVLGWGGIDTQDASTQSATGAAGTSVIKDGKAFAAPPKSVREFSRALEKVQVGWTADRLQRYAGTPKSKTEDFWIYSYQEPTPPGATSGKTHHFWFTVEDGTVQAIRKNENAWRKSSAKKKPLKVNPKSGL